MSHMESIGVRELRRDASKWLARVQAGETFLVTDRGKPVAQLAPPPPPRGWDALVAAGLVKPGSGRPLGEILDELWAMEPEPEPGSVSAALAELRADER